MGEILAICVTGSSNERLQDGFLMASKRVGLSKRVRFEVFKRDGFKCQYCGAHPPSVVLEVDHIDPVSQDGEDGLDNLITACFDCNRGKSDKLLSSIPKNLKDRMGEIEERKEQVKAYTRLIKSEARRLEKEIDQVQAEFKKAFDGFEFSPTFRKSVQRFLTKLPVIELVAYMALATSRISDRNGAIKYFCGICWKSIKGESRA